MSGDGIGFGEEVAELRIGQLEREVDRLTQELAAAQRSLIEAGTEHARDLGHLADRNRELDTLTKAIAECYGEDPDAPDGLTPYEQLKSVESCWKMEHDDANRANRELAERTRERDDARREVCRMARQAQRKLTGGRYDIREVAKALGWGYLYPEESVQ